MAGSFRPSCEWPLLSFTELCRLRGFFTEPASSGSANCVLVCVCVCASAQASQRFWASEETFVSWKAEPAVTHARRTDAQRRQRLPASTSGLLIAIIRVCWGNSWMTLTTSSSGCRSCLCPVLAPSASSALGYCQILCDATNHKDLLR